MIERAGDLPRRKQLRYSYAFYARHGLGPWPCVFCNEETNSDRFHVHHVDGDHSNDDPENLMPAHVGCHLRHHTKGRKHEFTEEHKANLAAAAKGRPGHPQTPETRAKIGAAHKGRKHSKETKRKISEAHRRRRTNDEG